MKKLVISRSLRLMLVGWLGIGCVGCVAFETSSLDSATGEGSLLAMILLAGTISPIPTLYVAGGNNCTIFTSSDGKAWSTATQPLPNCVAGAGAVYTMHFADGLFWAGGSLTTASSGCGLWSSPDAKSWTQRQCTVANAVIRSFTSGFVGSIGTRVFVAGSTTGTPAAQTFMVSTNGGATWTERTGPAAAAGDYVGSLAFFNNIFVATTTNTAVTTRSTDGGSSWSASGTTGMAFSTTTFPVLIATADRFVAEGLFSGFAYYLSSMDSGASWANSFTGTAASAPHRAVAYSADQGRLVMMHDGCSVRTATTYNAFDSGITMGTVCSGIDWRTVVYDPGLKQFVAAGNATTGVLERFAYSPSGLVDTWTINTTSTNANTINAMAVRPAAVAF